MYKIPLTKPYLTTDMIKRVQETMESGFWTEGPVVNELEFLFETYIGCGHALAVTSCTTGLEIALRALGIGAGDEVIVPDYTHPATAQVVFLVGAVPVIVDVDPCTMNIDYDSIVQAISPRTKAVIPVSIFGNPINWPRLDEIKRKYSLLVIEDAACAIGSSFQGVRTGYHPDISVFSLHPRKTIAIGEGGMITTNSSRLYDWMKSYKNFGAKYQEKSDLPMFTGIGTNCKLSDITASIGLEQIKQVDVLVDRRRELAASYTRLLEGIEPIEFQKVTMGGEHAYQSFCIQVDNRDMIKKEMRQAGIEVQIGTFALHRENAFHPSPMCKLPALPHQSLNVFERTLALPMYHDMTLFEQKMVVNALVKLIRKDS
ncbi:MAG: DegT/DnrJ/EryC1/StrS family aminotransferase [Proteobacteria bacterium]|nr:DegT/DnrJ/EryC1/StrS family aminotransferase [Desulfobacula sp.]MBU4133635.1 DegT/DnrJ/EryC1/StrS family aminotransferase [Pseudomonadota bacterium]